MKYPIWSRGTQALLTDDEYLQLRAAYNRNMRLGNEDQDRQEEFDYEDNFGDYEWLIRRILTGQV